ncbi:hypothetical protein AGOR_G00191900 [Albula goreensis]|uniref:SEA domain-containing protein n=1 Tax=Albula goreensis TaxID=1534307 RepID=A0A8T3CR30_9TELE|nr:hypothetical protein AGOR_G00191900 [Albula goreensis]
MTTLLKVSLPLFQIPCICFQNHIEDERKNFVSAVPFYCCNYYDDSSHIHNCSYCNKHSGYDNCTSDNNCNQSHNSPTEPETIYSLVFTSEDTFTPALANPQSQAFKDRADLTKRELEPIYRRAYGTFKNLNVISFRSGSIITNASLTFRTTTATPNNNQVADTLSEAVQDSQASVLNINPNTIAVNSTAVTVSSGASSHTSIFTATCVGMMSLLLCYIC